MNEQLQEILAAKIFIDTNILFYGVNVDSSEKYTRASSVLAYIWQKSVFPNISTQVLQEFYVTLIRNKVDIDRAQKIVKDYYVWNVVSANTGLISDAFHFQKRYLLSFWDSLVVASAQYSNCSYILTEDLNHNQKFGKLIVINPFHGVYDS